MSVCLLKLCLLSMSAADVPPVADKAELVRPIVAGSMLPEQGVVVDGEDKPLRTVLGEGKHVLIVYRGGWCPYCTRHFSAVGMAKADLEARGWRISGLSPDAPAAVAAWKEKHGDDGLQRLSDSDADAMRALGLAFQMPADLVMTYKNKYKIDLEAAAGGQTHHILPVPAVLLIVDGEVRAVHADVKYQRRLHVPVLKAMVDAVEADSKKK